MAFDMATVTAHIAALTVNGKNAAGTAKAVTMLDYNGIKETADTRLCPMFQPDINRQVTFQVFQRDSFGPGTVAKQTLYYTVPYVLLYEPAGATRGLFEVLPNMVYTMSAIITALVNNDTPQSGGLNSNLSVDMQIAAFTLGGIVNDPSGNAYHGVNVDVLVREFIN